MTSHADIVRRAGAEEISLRLGVSVNTVRAWINRNSIPANHWAAFAAHDWATLEELALTVAKKAAA